MKKEDYDKKYLKLVMAYFKPKNTQTLKKETIGMIGQIGIFQYGWIVEEGTYTGQWAMNPLTPPMLHTFTWCPEEDLEIIKQ